MKKASYIWWLNPINIYIVITLIAVYAYTIPSKTYWILYGVREKHIEPIHIVLYFFCLILFCVGCKFAKGFYWGEPSGIIRLKRSYNYMLFFCILAYVVWAGRFISIHGFGSALSIVNPNALVSNMYIFRQHSGRIPGITSMTEFGVVLAPLSIILFEETKEKKYIKFFVGLLFLSVVRALYFSERLAFVELLVPAFFTFFSYKEIKRKYNFIPIIALVILFVMFGIFEYTRSWSRFYVDYYKGSYVDFVVNRVLGYYTIAVNTECTALHFKGPNYFPSLTLQWIWQFPGLKSVPEMIQGPAGSQENLLELYGNEEFNNPGGMLTFIRDFGSLGMFLSFAFGRIVGGFYKAFKQNYLAGQICYPICLLCLIELPRYFFFGNNRAFFILFGMAFICWKIRSEK